MSIKPPIKSPSSWVFNVFEFHQKFGLEYDGPPRELPFSLQAFRSKFMAEELEEYNIAIATGDMAKALDSLVDLIYVALGTAHFHGFDISEAWDRVHAANMKKVRTKKDGSDSLRNNNHDVVKPPGWTAPDLSDLV